MARNNRRLVWMFRIGAFASALLLASLMVVRTSQAAFTATTSNSGSSFTAGTVTLVDDDSGSARFAVTAMKPGDTTTACILVTYQGTVANPLGVKLYSGGFTDSGTFGNYLKLTVEEGTPGTFAGCGAFVAANTIVNAMTLTTFNSTHTNYSNGVGVWDPSGTPESKTYRFTVLLDPATPNSQQGASVTGLTFTWEVQSN